MSDSDTRTRPRQVEADDVRTPQSAGLKIGPIDLSLETLEIRELRLDAARTLLFLVVPFLAMTLIWAWEGARRAATAHGVTATILLVLSFAARRYPLPAVVIGAFVSVFALVWYSPSDPFGRDGFYGRVGGLCIEWPIWLVCFILFVRAFDAATKYQKMR